MGDLFCILYKYYMKINEATKILNDRGYILESNEDKGAEVSKLLKSHGFKHKPYSIFRTL